MIRHIFILFISMTLGIFLVQGFLGATGFCWQKRTWLTEADLINGGLLSLVSRSKRDIEYFSSFSEPFDKLTTDDISIFRSQNPECCGIFTKTGYDLPKPKVMEVWLGMNYGKPIDVKYTNDKNEFNEFSFFIDNCSKRYEY